MRTIHEGTVDCARLRWPGIRPCRVAADLSKNWRMLQRPAKRRLTFHDRCSCRCFRAVYFATPEPFELEVVRPGALPGTLPVRPWSLSRSASVFRSFFRPLTRRSENSFGSIDEIRRVSGEGVDRRPQVLRMRRKKARSLLRSEERRVGKECLE